MTLEEIQEVDLVVVEVVETAVAEVEIGTEVVMAEIDLMAGEVATKVITEVAIATMDQREMEAVKETIEILEEIGTAVRIETAEEIAKNQTAVQITTTGIKVLGQSLHPLQ